MLKFGQPKAPSPSLTVSDRMSWEGALSGQSLNGGWVQTNKLARLRCADKGFQSLRH